ncbi:DUF998 domain-containing protein [Lysobacter sp. LF1]|uniref:DUF998 domain-containing protein n=1 Tax=Lysobacter stagni TaxID=3045172 RepID=A0ABT6XIK6_9GAMM|nr:DUF998 domain-containing protein [Lysobacter sp. LF1]MDI9239991.1 DUF998 domain-containing protein [Lysobacter sp. LF1]
MPAVAAQRSLARARGMGTLALACVLAFTTVATVLQGVRADLDWVRAPLSFYLVGPHALWLQVAYIALAIALATLGAGFHAATPPARRSVVPMLLFVIGAMALAVTAMAETDLGRGGEITLAARIHGIAAPIAFLGTTLAMLLQSWRFRADPDWRRHFALGFGLAVACFLALWVHALWRELPRGLSQKAVIVAILAWLALAAGWLRRTPERSLY